MSHTQEMMGLGLRQTAGHVTVDLAISLRSLSFPVRHWAADPSPCWDVAS